MHIEILWEDVYAHQVGDLMIVRGSQGYVIIDVLVAVLDQLMLTV